MSQSERLLFPVRLTRSHIAHSDGRVQGNAVALFELPFAGEASDALYDRHEVAVPKTSLRHEGSEPHFH